MKIQAFLLSFFIISGLFCQEENMSGSRYEGPALTPYDSVMLSNLPVLQLLPVLKMSELPYAVDNSELPYYRPIYQQLSAECGQVSGIAYNFTYEINRLRNLPANVEENQYPTHFTYNFMNGGYGWHGVSYFHSFEILKAAGCPSVDTYGGMAAGGDTRWMSGYDEYYGAMKNRIRNVYQIQVSTEEGLLQLKQWLHNHLSGSESGGVASFYANAPWNPKILADTTPEGGKHVIVSWGGLPTHAMTIVGYNDSIRWDYNSDGQYTNHLDINNDGKVDMRDWEIGGLLFADGWGSGINFADSGKCYMMYKTLAEKTYEGGIWNHSVHVLDVKDLESPQLTARICIQHTRRGMLRIQCGVSSNPNDSLPEYSIGFPIFDFQGGSQYMQGGISIDSNKTIEFGLDISPLLGHINNMEDAAFFLFIEEYDPIGLGEGSILHYSVIDYSGTEPLEVVCEDPLTMIHNDSITIKKLVFPGITHNVAIATNGIPEAIVGQPYSFQLHAEGGTEPYQWHFKKHCSEEVTFREIDSLGVYTEPGHWVYGNIPYALPFPFRLYDKYYDSIFIHPGGFILFEDSQYPWPYLYDEALLIRNTPIIAPFLCRWLEYVPAFGQGIWIHEESDQLMIRWKGDIQDYSYSPVVEFALILNSNHEATFIYGTEIESGSVHWSCGVSEGNDLNFHMPQIERSYLIPESYAVILKTNPLPENLELSEEGLLSGTMQHYYQQVELSFCVEDDDRIRAFKTLEFSSSNLGIDEDIQSTLTASVFPNPFGSRLSIQLKNGMSGPLLCKVYSVNGKMLKIIADLQDAKGAKTLYWDGKDASGSDQPPGIYFIHLQNAGTTKMIKIIHTGK